MDIKYVEQFKEKLANIGNYKLIGEYLGAKVPCIILGECGHQWNIISGNLFSRGSGKLCPICNNTGTKYLKEVFAERIKFRFNLDLVGEYINSKTPCIVKDIKCGHEWTINPSGLLSQGNLSLCPVCSSLWSKEDILLLKKLYSEDLLHILDICKRLNKSEEQIRYKVHKLNITRNGRAISLEEDTRLFKIINLLEKNNYTNIKESKDLEGGHRIDYTCNKGHNIGGQLSNNIFSHNRRCPICADSTKVSKGEVEVLEYIKSILPNNTWIEQNDRNILGGKELDIVLPDLGIAIEYNGNYWHSDEMVGENKHNNKFIEVENFGYRLITITDEEWLTKQEIVKSRLNTIFNLNKVIYARKCKIKEISYANLSSFCNINHIQGSTVSSINLGLYNTGTLVAVMSFSKSRYTKEYEYELIRYCSSINVSVIGGASKLFKYFERKYSPISIISYSDRRWNTGNLYIKLGFILKNISAPNYRYIKGMKSYNRQKFMKHKLKELFPDIYSENKTEKEIMREAGYHRVYDCGNMVFTKVY